MANDRSTFCKPTPDAVLFGPHFKNICKLLSSYFIFLPSRTSFHIILLILKEKKIFLIFSSRNYDRKQNEFFIFFVGAEFFVLIAAAVAYSTLHLIAIEKFESQIVRKN